MLERYQRLLDVARPYAVLNEKVRPFTDLAPLGLAIAPSDVISPFHRRSDAFLNRLEWLDRMTFGFAGMEMPRWVFYDCSEMPGGICGFTMPASALPASLFHEPPATPDEPVPVSMAIVIPMMPAGCWHEHTLCSINELSSTAAPGGLRTITLALALRLFRVRTVYGATQWRSSELRVLTKFGELELITAYTPAHTEARTLTYRFEVTEARLRRALSGRDAYVEPPGGSFLLDADDRDAMRALQADIEGGRRLVVCGRPVRDGSTTWVPLREGSP